MKSETKSLLIMLMVLPMSLFGCSGSNTEPAVLDKTVNEQAYENAPNVPVERDTAEAESKKYVSADNRIGGELNILGTIQQNSDLSTLFELIRAAGMETALQSPGSYTMFAPNNKAFAALPKGTVESLKDPASKTELTRLLQAHIVDREIPTAEMQGNMTEKTEQGDDLIIKRSGQTINVGGATIIIADVDASNGMVHVINKVLVPPTK